MAKPRPSAGSSAATDQAGFRVLAAFEGHARAVERQNADVLKMAQELGGAGQADPGRDCMMDGLRRAVDPEDPAACPLTLKVSVPIAFGLRTCVAIGRVSAECGVAAKATLLAGNGIVLLHAAEAGEEIHTEWINGVKELVSREGGHVTPVHGARRLLSQWGSRVDDQIERLVLRPVKENLDPAGVLPPII